MQDSKTKSPNNDIQPISFSNILWLVFDAIINFLKHLILFSYKNRILLLSFLMLGIVSGIIMSKLRKPSYLVSMLVKQTELTPRAFGQMTKELDKLAKTGSEKELNELLKLPANISGSVVGVTSRNMQGLDLEKDTSQLGNKTFILELALNNNEVADTVQKAIIRYFNNNPFLKKLKDDKTELYLKRLSFLEAEIKKLDTLKAEYNKFLSAGSTSTFYNNAFNPVDLYQQSSLYQEEKNSIEEWLRQSKESLISINGFAPTAIPQTMSTLNYILLYGILFLAFGCLIAAIRAVIQGN